MDQGKLNDLIFGGHGVRRFTQDSPVLPDVWLAYWQQPEEPQDLLLTPYSKRSASDLARAIRERLTKRTARTPARIAYTATYVAVSLTYDELLWAALPLSRWWRRKLGIEAQEGIGPALASPTSALLEPGDRRRSSLSDAKAQLTWFVELAGLLALPRSSSETTLPDLSTRAGALSGVFDGRERMDPRQRPLLWTISRNRPAHPAIWRSRPAIKADAADRLFAISCEGIRWAVIDSGVDAMHPAFVRRRDVPEAEADAASKADYRDIRRSRVVATYDFTRLRDLQARSLEPTPRVGRPPKPPYPKGREQDYKDLVRSLQRGRMVDWGLLEPLLRMPHDGDYRAPEHEHGTHVAGILAADWPQQDDEGPPTSHLVKGICPQLEVYDLRVLNDDGEGEEFSVVAALQFIRYLNSYSERRVIHGVNLSLSIRHDVRNFACGRTPVCEEAERLVANGVVVVAAAGNEGFAEYATSDGPADGYRTVSITDPGNAENVITVGATHRSKPHTYGISYFSSRGPTGDGRSKPDLVAPGEKIQAPVPGGRLGIHDGTSMAAPHVSGAAALLMGRHRELIGQPAKVKQTLCRAATDLGRERHFQGAGMVDVLRAIQSV
jgi:serine protease AprX